MNKPYLKVCVPAWVFVCLCISDYSIILYNHFYHTYTAHDLLSPFSLLHQSRITCPTSEESVTSRLPDTCAAVKLHLECGSTTGCRRVPHYMRKPRLNTRLPPDQIIRSSGGWLFVINMVQQLLFLLNVLKIRWAAYGTWFIYCNTRMSTQNVCLLYMFSKIFCLLFSALMLDSCITFLAIFPELLVLYDSGTMIFAVK